MSGAAYVTCCVIPYFLVRAVWDACRRCLPRDERARDRGVLSPFDPTASDESGPGEIDTDDMDIDLDDGSNAASDASV